ncbi:hypothetical protein MMC09_007045 [Bachmanniomyces sp. S44760]|nr:hypothetical protein [Bachmanniomyces sp. S44760]
MDTLKAAIPMSSGWVYFGRIAVSSETGSEHRQDDKAGEQTWLFPGSRACPRIPSHREIFRGIKPSRAKHNIESNASALTQDESKWRTNPGNPDTPCVASVNDFWLTGG